MNKKLIVLLLLSIFMLGLFSGAVEAKESVWQKIKNSEILIFLTVDIVEEFQKDDPSTTAKMVGKILFVILLFAILFGGTAMAPGLKDFSKNIRIAISLLISIIAGIAVPTKWLTSVMKVYGGGLILALLFIPAIILVYANFKLIEGKDRGSYAIKCLLMLGMVFVLQHAGNVANDMIGVVSYAIDIASYIAGFLVVWYLFTGVIANKSTEAGEAVKTTIPGLDKAFKRWKSRDLRKYVAEEKEVKLIDAAEGALNDAKSFSSQKISQRFENEGEVSVLEENFKKAENGLKEAHDFFRQIKKWTYRESIGMKKVIDKLKAANKSTTELESLENNIIKKHQGAANDLQKAMAEFTSMKAQYMAPVLTHLKNSSKTTFPMLASAPWPGIPWNAKKYLETIVTKIDVLLKKVRSAKKKEDEAVKDLRGSLVKAQELLDSKAE